MEIGALGEIGKLAVQHVEEETKQGSEIATAQLQLMAVQTALDSTLRANPATHSHVP